MRKSIIAAILALSFFSFVSRSWANVAVTPASGGTNLSADKAGNAISPAWTTLGQIIIDEVSTGNKNDFGSGTGVTLILKTPGGFQFNTSVVPNITFTSARDISSATIAVTDSNTVTVTLTVTGTANIDKLTIGNTTGLQVRPTLGSPLAAARNIYRPTSGGGTATISGIIANADGSAGTSFGALSEVAGSSSKLAFSTEPGSATAGLIFGVQPVVKTTDQFGNSSTSGLPANLNVTNTLTLGTGTLLGKTVFDIGTAAGKGTVTYTNLQIDVRGTNKQLTAKATGLSDAVSQLFTVNGPPLLSSVGNQAINEDTPTAAIPFTVDDLETNPDALTISSTSSNTNLVANADLVLGGSGTNRTLTITPLTNQFGTTTITISASDGSLSTNILFVLTVNSVNDTPTLNSIGDLGLRENDGLQTINLAGISSGASNESQSLTITATSSNPSLIPNPNVTYTTPNSTGSISFTPLAGAVGSTTITVKVQDNGGTNFGGVDFITRTFLVTVSPVNDAPTLNPINDLTINEDAALQTINLSGITTGATNEFQVLTVTATSSNPSLIPNPTVTYTSPNTNGSISFAPLTNAFGSATITVKVQDDGGTNVGGIDSFTRTFLVTVSPINDAPTLNSIGDLTINEDSALQTVALNGIGSGVTNEAQSLNITVSSSNPSLIPNPTLNYTSPNNAGSISFTAVTNAFGSSTITVTIQDSGGTNSGGVDSLTRTFLVTVNPVNDAPTLNPISDLTISQDASTTNVSFSGITSGATNESQSFTVSAISSNPTLIPNPTVSYVSPNTNGSLSFAPLTNASGTTTITVTVQDNGGTANGGSNSFSRQFVVTVIPRSDVGISQTAAPNPVSLGADLSFVVTVTNNGPSIATTVVVTNILPENATFVSATTSQGSSTNQGGVLTCNLGNIASHGIASINITVTTFADGSVTNTASVTTTAFDPNPTNNNSSAIVSVVPPPIVFEGGTLIAEGCVNGAIDSAETVTVNFSLKNTGSANTTNLIATLRNTGGVTGASAPQNYGAMVAGGASVSRPFTFVPIGHCGSTFSATLQLQDGGKNVGVVTYVFTLGTTVTNTIQATKTNSISISFNAASPYPSTNRVSGLQGPILKVAVRLNNLSHTQPDDLDILLVGPNGEKVLVMSDCGGASAINNVTLTLDDTAASSLPDSSQIVTGTFKPTNFGSTDVFPAPAPIAPYAADFSVFNGGNPNGEWQLFINDDFSSFSGSMAGGWTLILTTLEPSCCVPTNAVDLSLTASDSPDPVVVGNDLVYTIIVTNYGPATATGVTLTNPLPPGVSFVSAIPSQGTATNASGIVICNLGTLASNVAANVQITVKPTLAGTTITNVGVIKANQPDYQPGNNTVETLTTVNVPTLSINAVSVVEGNTNAVFTLVLSSPSSQTLSVNYATADDTATGGSDYFSTNGTVTFTLGQTNKTITVGIRGDLLNEATEFFFVNLSNPVNVTIAEGQGIGIITDDDPLPSIFISDATVTEGNIGTTNINFVVSLVPVSGQIVTVNYSTANGSADSSSDYESASGTITFNPGQTNQILGIVIRNDTTNELTETFFVNLTNQVNASIGDAQAVGTILNDDLLPNIVVASSSVVSETCTPTNRLVDPGETVTMSFSLRNAGTGTANSTNLVATLLATGGVTSPSAAQNYGALTNGGPSVARSFTFGANGNCGSTISAIFQLQDGANNLGTVTNFILLGAFSSETNSFSNSEGVTILDFGGASPYPSMIDVSGVTGAVTKVTVTLTNLSHTYPADLDVLLVGPGGEKVLLMSDTGLGFGVASTTLIFDDAATNSLPETGQIVSGRFKPTNIGANDSFAAPAPGEPYGISLSAFTSLNPNGAWSLYIYDDTGGDAGALAGWKLSITSLSDPICCGVNSLANLGVSITDSPDPVSVGSNVTYTILVTNSGPYAAAGVTLIDTLPTGMNFVSATSTNGSCTNQNGTITCKLGSLNNGATATIFLTVNAVLVGTLTNTVTVFSNSGDPVSTNNTAAATTKVLPVVDIFVTDAVASETGNDVGIFTLNRTGGTGNTLTVRYAVSGTASNGQDFATLSGLVTFPTNSSTATITVTPIDDFLVEPTETVVVTLLPDPAYILSPFNTSGSIDLFQDDGQGLSVSTTFLAVPENGTNAFQVQLTAQPTNTVTVTTTFSSGDTNLSIVSGAILIFNFGNWNIPQSVSIGASHDFDLVNGQALFTVSSPGLSNEVVTATELDSDFVTFLLSTNVVAVPENGTNSLTVRLNVQPTNNFTATITRTSGETNLNVIAGAVLNFTTNNWNNPQTVVLSDGEDLNAVNGQAIFTISSTSASNVTFTGIEIENDVQMLLLSTNSLTVAEGTTNTFTVRLTAQPTGNVVVTTAFSTGDTNLGVASGTNLTFSTANWNITQIVGIRATQDNDAANGQATFTVSSPGLTNQTVIATEADDDTLDFVVSTNTLNVAEGGSSSFTVFLTAAPTNNFVVNTVRSSGDTNLNVAVGASLTFNSTNWNIPKTVTIAASQDDDAVNGQAIFTVSSTGFTNQTLTANEIDNDTLNLIVSTNSVSVPEGGTNTFTLRLGAQPTNVVLVDITNSGDTNLTLLGATNFVFDSSNWNIVQLVTLAASEDADAVNGQGIFTLSSPGFTNQIITVTEIDNDSLNIIFSTNSISVPEGGTNSFTVRLGAAPTNNTTLSISRTGDTNINISGATNLFFDSTSWNIAQVVVLSATEDNDAVNGQSTFVFSGAGLTNASVIALEIENDTQSLLVSTNLISIPEGSTNTFTVRLTAEPTNTVSVTIIRTSGDTDLALASSGTLTFNSANWNATQTVSLAAAEDNDAVNGQAIFTVSSAGLSNVTITAIEIENDFQSLLLSTNSLTVSEGATNTFTVRLTAAPTNNVVVTTVFASGDTDLIVASGSNLTFTSSNWNVTQTVRIRAAEDDDAVNGQATFTISSAGMTNQTLVATELDNDVLNFVLSTNSLSVSEGGTNTFTVRLTAQPTNNIVVNTVRFSGDTNLNVASGAALTFDSTNWNVPQNVQLTATEDNNVVNGQATFRVSSIGFTNQFVAATEIDNDILTITVSTNDLAVPEGTTVELFVQLSAQPTNALTVSVSRSGDLNLDVIGETNFFFDSANWNVAQTVIIGAYEDFDAINSAGAFIFSAPGLLSVNVTAIEIDNDTQDLLVSDELISVPEGNTNSFSVRLTAQPTNTVSVNIARTSGDTNLNLVTSATLIFNPTNWNFYQTVLVSATEDDDAVNGEAILTISSSGLLDRILTVVEVENDTQSILVSTNVVVVPEGGSNSFTVHLSAEPTNTISVLTSRSSGDTDLNVDSGATLTFTPANWNISQTVFLSASEDDDADHGSAIFTVTSAGWTGQTVSITESDNDIGFLVSTNLLRIDEGQSNVFTIRLNLPPANDVAVSIVASNADPDISISTNSLVFNPGNWDIAQPITVNAAEDNDNTNGQTTLIITSPGLVDQIVSLVENDNDVQALVLCPGEIAQFNMSPADTGQFIYAWFRDGFEITGETNNSILISNVTSLDAGLYSVHFTNGTEVVTNSATLTVNTNTSASALVSLIECPGDNATFSTTPSGTGPFTFVWRKDGSVIANQTNASLTLLSVVATNAGTYSVIVSGNCNSV
ncbi:MAG: Calx-beta domain-containing protein, partial [Verrucomicrobiota bacterium]